MLLFFRNKNFNILDEVQSTQSKHFKKLIPGETHLVESCQAQKISIGSSREVVEFRLANPTEIPIIYDRILSRFTGFYRIPMIPDHWIECPGMLLPFSYDGHDVSANEVLLSIESLSFLKSML